MVDVGSMVLGAALCGGAQAVIAGVLLSLLWRAARVASRGEK